MQENTMPDKPIDAVVTWVDGSDPQWYRQKQQYQKNDGAKGADEANRYRDWGWIRYWFRGIEKFAPWMRRVHFVTWGHLPDFLNTENDRLHIVRHEDFMPAEVLPVFNSNAIEVCMHQIKGLSEQFLYFNDDMFLIRPVRTDNYFRNGKPCDMLAFQPVIANPENPVMSKTLLNDTLVLAKYFVKRENVKKQPGAYFHPGYPIKYFGYNLLELAFPQMTGYYSTHSVAPLCKSTYEQLWEKEPELMQRTAASRIRSGEDTTIYLMREWQKLTGNFCPKNMQKDFAYFSLAEHNEKLCRMIREQRRNIVCINDVRTDIPYEQVKREVSEAFETILPDKCSFEK